MAEYYNNRKQKAARQGKSKPGGKFWFSNTKKQEMSPMLERLFNSLVALRMIELSSGK